MEDNLTQSAVNFIDVYERNLELEQELKDKAEELNQANKTILTIGNVWDLMNSSMPIASALEKIVNSLQQEIGYVNGIVIQKKEDSSGVWFKLKAIGKSKATEKLRDYLDASQTPLRVPFSQEFIFAKALKEHSTICTQDFASVAGTLFASLSHEFIDEVLSISPCKTVITVPLYTKSAKTDDKEEDFGCMIVFSDRDTVTQNELNFLNLLAGQTGLVATIAKLFVEIRKQAVTDPLTGLFNRRYFEDNLEREAERSLRLRQPFSLVSLDLDHLKQINDTYGHQWGDVAIKTISDVLKNKARSIDIAARIGGEEFSILLQGIDSYGAMIAAERIRAAIEAVPVEKVGTVTASIGVATFLEHTEDLRELTELADKAMYQAKVNGRNQVRAARRLDDENWQRIAVNAFIDILAKQKIRVPSDVAVDITTRLNSVVNDTSGVNEIIYSVVDLLTRTYNSKYSPGATKSKLMTACRLAEKMNLSEKDTDKLKIAMLLYDIGNLMLPEEIFNKSEPLTDEEKQLIKSHPVIAARDILKPLSSIKDVVPLIEKHHENWDGTGYPGNIKGNDIPVESQIILLVDAFYALTQDRPYRKAYDVQKALEIIEQGAGKKWNAELVEKFVPLVRKDDSE